MFKFKKTWSVVFLILLFLALLILIQIYQEKTIGNEVDEHGCLISAGYTWNSEFEKCVRQWEINSRTYSSKDLDYCSKITIDCIPDYESFYDNTGCGCQPESAIQESIYCTEKQRKTDACIEIYKPVCAYLNTGNLETYSNACFACMYKKVISYQEGEC